MANKRIAPAKETGSRGSGSDLERQAKVVGEASKGMNFQEASASNPNAGDSVTAMMGRLKLTAKEAKTFVLDDADPSIFGGPEWALVGKVLAPNTLHVETIKAVVKPAWGNPKGMMVRPMGPNLFLAEFESKADMQHVINGAPWFMGKNSIFLKELFRRMIGDVVKLEVDEKGRAWGDFLRARVDVDITEPLMRWVTVESANLNKTVLYEVKYEKLPMFCFSCVLIGHSSLVCPTPASQDENGKLPWNNERVCVPDMRKNETRSSSGHGSMSGQGSSTHPVAEKKNPEVKSPMKPCKPRARQDPAAAKGQNPCGGAAKSAGQKRKQVYVVKSSKALAITNGHEDQAGVGLGGDAGDGGGAGAVLSEGARSDNSNKKQKNSANEDTNTRSADLVGVVEQPRRTH
ncbi:hypothetical protein ACQ4PT_013561 [Festuca glaucescens]